MYPESLLLPSTTGIECLSRLISPVSCQDFFGTYWGKQLIHISGNPDKFSHLLTWEALTQILCSNRFSSQRLKLRKNRQPISSTEYLQAPLAYAEQGGHLSPVGFLEQLRTGTTFILDAIDELHPLITEVARSLEFLFHEYIQINCYVSSGSETSFDMHFDLADVMVLQVYGKKHWEIYGTTRPVPLRPDYEPAPRPENPPLEKIDLLAGDFLYLPRGTWHKVYGQAEISVHLSLSIPNRTGIHFMYWIVEQLKQFPLFRQDLPRFTSPVHQSEYLHSLINQLTSFWSVDLLQQFFQNYDAQAISRPHIALPWNLLPEVLPPTDTFSVRLTSPRPLHLRLDPENQQIFGFLHGKEFGCHISALPLLEHLNSGKLCSFQELLTFSGMGTPVEKIREFLKMLTVEGFLEIHDG